MPSTLIRLAMRTENTDTLASYGRRQLVLQASAQADEHTLGFQGWHDTVGLKISVPLGSGGDTRL